MPAVDLPLPLQTAYAELVDRCVIGAFEADFAEEGQFVRKLVNGRTYWYFQFTANDGQRRQRYVGPESPGLLARIESHRTARTDYLERRKLVSTLIRSAGLTGPDQKSGRVLRALAEAGVFRLRAVLVGTLAYQTYSAMLGVLLPKRAAQTGDVDIAQFREISIAVEDQTPPILDVLRKVDPTFREVPYAMDSRRVAAFQARGQYRVEFLTPNTGPDTDEPQRLEALGIDAQPMRFLDYLIYEPLRAVVLHDSGVLVNVPTPERYAMHKLIVARRRRESAAKIDKDLAQAGSLLDVLAAKRPEDLRAAAAELLARGPKWRELAESGWRMLDSELRERVKQRANVSLA